MAILKELYKNGKIFEFFDEISKIPRASENTSGIAAYLADFAEARGLEYIRDGADNVIIKKPATIGYEERPTIILQGHTDMVGVSEAGDFDFENRAINIGFEGDFIFAEDTTLGADDGVAMAYMLAILDADNIPHPSIETVFTSNEEIGLLGAAALDTSSLFGRLMINIDSDVEGEFTVGCAGGIRLDIELPTKREANTARLYKLEISGLSGGHSGTEINSGHINAIKLTGEILTAVGGRISELNSGCADNAIPAEAVCIFASKMESYEISGILNKIREKYLKNERAMKFSLQDYSADTVLDKKSSDSATSLINSLPSGVVKMSESVPGAVETSANAGIAKTDADCFRLTMSLRSSVASEKEELKEKIYNITSSYGAITSEHGEYPEWEYKEDSYLREKMLSVYKEMYGCEPKILNIHAGLECGIFARKLSGLDCISLGPDNFDIHTPKERLSIQSFIRVFEYLKKVLKEI